MENSHESPKTLDHEQVWGEPRCNNCGYLEGAHYDGVRCPLGNGLYSIAREFEPIWGEPRCPWCGPICDRSAAHNARVETEEFYKWTNPFAHSVKP